MDVRPQSTGSDSDGSKRKRRAIAQGQKACNPCRLRKVRCSYQSPCHTCVERQHPELCLYDAPVKRVRLEPALVPVPASPPAGAFLLSQEGWRELLGKIDQLNQGMQALRRELARRPSATRSRDGRGDDDDGFSTPNKVDLSADLDAGCARDIHTAHPLTGASVFLGSNSVPAMAVALSQANGSDTVRDLFDKSILPIFTLENESTTYPFIDLWGLPHASNERIERLCALLPADAECLQYLRQYRDTAHVLFPGIVNLQQFEAEVMQFLVARSAKSAGSDKLPLTDQDVYGRSVHWLGLLFACLASGCQCSSMPRREKQLTSQVYVCCAYECLRIVNYLSCSQLDDIQNLLVLGNVISNNMNAGVAWVLLGLTTRLAQGMGLHHAPPSNTSIEETNLRNEVWSRIIWQDSLLSISYDRATPTIAMTRRNEPHAPEPEGSSYAECMLQLCTIALNVVYGRTTTTSAQREAQQIDDHRQGVLAIGRQAHGHLRELSSCASMRDYLEHWNWHMHRSYVISELYRPILTKLECHDEVIRNLRTVCIEALTNTVDAFLNLHNMTAFARMSWAAVHRSLSSALLLGILKEPAHSERVRVMLDRFIAVMSSMEYSEPAEVPTPITRAVAALLRLNVREGDDFHFGDAGSTVSSFDEESPHAQVQHIMWGSSSRDLSIYWVPGLG